MYLSAPAVCVFCWLFLLAVLYVFASCLTPEARAYARLQRRRSARKRHVVHAKPASPGTAESDEDEELPAGLWHQADAHPTAGDHWMTMTVADALKTD